MDFDLEEAKRLLKLHREAATAEKSSIRLRLRSSPDGVYSYTEANHVLAEVVGRNGRVGLVQALLSLGADVNFTRRRSLKSWDKLARRHQQEERSDILQRATRQGSAEIVHALADYSDQITLDSALLDAMARQDLAVMKALLVHGADPAELHEDFLNLISQNHVSMVKLLLEGPRLPCLSCRSSGLRIAVKNKTPEMMRILLKSGADINHDSASALLLAVDCWRPDFVAMLIGGPVAPLPSSLDQAAGRAHSKMGADESDEGRAILHMCLEGGGAGPETNRILTKGVVDAVRNRQLQLLDTLLKFTTPSGQYEAVTLVEAIKAQQIDTLVKLLAFKPSPQSLTVSVGQAIQEDDVDVRYKVTQLLIGAGAQGQCVADAFIEVTKWVIDNEQYKGTTMEETDRKIFDLLLDDGNADINHRAGRALQIAVTSPCMDVAWRIVEKQPSPDALGASLPLAMGLEDIEERRSMVEMLVRNNVAQEALDKALVEAVKGGPPNRPVIELLLSRGNINYNNGEAFIFAIRNSDKDTLRELLKQGASYKALFTATMEALKVARPERPAMLRELTGRLELDHLNLALKYIALEPYPDVELARVLLQAGADATLENGVCIKHAACNLDAKSLHVLTQFSERNEAIFTQAFLGLVNRGKQWIAFEHLELVNLLLSYGASGDVVNRAMVDVVDQLAGNPAQRDLAEKLVDMLIVSGADVNYEDGKVLGIAAGSGDAALLAQLLGQGATMESATFAFSTAIMAHHDEQQLLELIDVFVDERTTTPDVRRPLPGMLPPLLLCLNYYGSVALLDRLWKLGCDLDSTIPYEVYADESDPSRQSIDGFGKEPVTALMWALLQPDQKIGAHLIDAMIKRDADVSYMAPRSKATPLILAAKQGRLDVAQLLIEAGAKQPAKDVFQRSALFYASRSGNHNLVALLLNGKPGKNDGSLHEASRCFHPKVMQMLMDAGHDADYRSTKHGGRTALAEMALLGRIPADVSTAEEAAEMLKDAGANPLVQVHGSSVMFLALDNQEPVPIVQMLLEKILWKYVNDEACIYQEGDLNYSPTMYVAKGIAKSPPSASADLIRLLKDHGATDRYYATIEKAQPADAVGLPAHIQDYEDARRARERRLQLEEEEHSIALRREAEQAQHRVRIADLEHDSVIRHGDALSAQALRHRGLAHNQDIQIEAEKHHNTSNIAMSEANTRSRIGWQAHRDTEEMRAEVRGNDLAHAAQTRAADLEHARQVQTQRVNERAQNWELKHNIREQRHLQDLGHRAARDQQALGKREALHAAELRQKALDKAQDLEHKKQLDQHDYWTTVNKNRAQLAYHRAGAMDKLEAQKQIQWHDRENRLLQDQATSDREMRSHRMKMLELETERGNMIGKVNLEEWGRWKQIQGKAPSSHGEVGWKQQQPKLLTLN
ncbi:ankyrin [Thozetella sp. PMI_491]|nr:ankyrin [Thozetella sp. PMI_491]